MSEVREVRLREVRLVLDEVLHLTEILLRRGQQLDVAHFFRIEPQILEVLVVTRREL